jgi:hypothetical protein
MVGQQTLDLFILVQIQVPEQSLMTLRCLNKFTRLFFFAINSYDNYF